MPAQQHARGGGTSAASASGMTTTTRCMPLLACWLLMACDPGAASAPDGADAGAGEVTSAGGVALPIHGVDTAWSLAHPGAVYRLEQRVRITRPAPHMFWALMAWDHVEWDAGGAYQGAMYMGLQTDATAPGGAVGRMAIFSLWNGTAARGGDCVPF